MSRAGCTGPRRSNRSEQSGASREGRAQRREPGGVHGTPPIHQKCKRVLPSSSPVDSVSANTELSEHGNAGITSTLLTRQRQGNERSEMTTRPEKIAVVTGGARGIGLATAEWFLAHVQSLYSLISHASDVAHTVSALRYGTLSRISCSFISMK